VQNEDARYPYYQIVDEILDISGGSIFSCLRIYGTDIQNSIVHHNLPLLVIDREKINGNLVFVDNLLTIERDCGVLENNWGGEVIDLIEKALGLARSITYRGISPSVRKSTKIYRKGVTLAKNQ